MGHQEPEESPFEIVYNARSSRTSRSRKSSICIIDKDKPRLKTKKLRKMTLNPDSIRIHEIREIEELHGEHKGPRSERGENPQEDCNFDGFL